jgi:hypothetical protein
MRYLLILLAFFTSQASAQKANPGNSTPSTPIISIGTVLVYGMGDNNEKLTVRITAVNPLRFDYTITGSEIDKNGSISHSSTALNKGKELKIPAEYNTTHYSSHEYLTLWVSKEFAAAFKARKPAQLTIDSDDLSFGEVSETDFDINLHQKYFNSDKAYTSEEKYVHGIKRNLKCYSGSNAEGDATITIWANPAQPLLLYLSIPDVIELRLEAIL